MRMKNMILSPMAALLLFMTSVTTHAATQTAVCEDLLNHMWLSEQRPQALLRILENISRSDTKPGTVVAARTKAEPNYYYHWVRDAALVIQSLIEAFPAMSQEQRQVTREKFRDYLVHSADLQDTPTLTGMGEPKFNPDGSSFNDLWARPQNDGPALRALSVMQLARLMQGEQQGFGPYQLYNNTHIATIKGDLEYVAHHWREPSVDLWEEVYGDHFYTRMVQRRALREGALFARELGDIGAANFYDQQASEIEDSLVIFWDADRSIWRTTVNRTGGYGHKHSNIDVALLLAFNHGLRPGEEIRIHKNLKLSWQSRSILETAEHVENAFREIYTINQNSNLVAPAIGRYPEDSFGGSHTNGGNPWPLATLAIAETLYKVATMRIQNGRSRENALRLVREADHFIDRVRYHAHPDGSLNEQIHRDSGYMTSVEHLTWSYAALVTAEAARAQVFASAR